MSRTVLKSKDVVKLTGLSRVTVWRLSRDPENDFPASIQITENRVGWFEDELIEWLESRPRILTTTEATASLDSAGAGGMGR